jgi:hypothetical protein
MSWIIRLNSPHRFRQRAIKSLCARARETNRRAKNKSVKAFFIKFCAICVWCSIGMILVIGITGFRSGGHRRNPKSICIANLMQMDSAKEQWALDHHKGKGAEVTFADITGPTLYIKSRFTCPGEGNYNLNAIGTDPACTVDKHVLP